MKIEKIEDLKYNLITDTDSYKFSHWKLYPAGTEKVIAYFESRGGGFEESTLFGLQYLLHKYLSTQVTANDVAEAQSLALDHGVPFNYNGWMNIVNKYNGKLPVVIRAIPEGTVVPVSNALFCIECNYSDCFWLVGWVETMLSRLWYSSTIAINSREYAKLIKKFLIKSSDTPDLDLPFKLHDFGARGVSTLEQSRIGGTAHLLSFLGTDTFEALRLAKRYYDCDMAGYSIPATEHSLVCINGRENEYKFFDKLIDTYLVNRVVPEGMPKLVASVSDSFNIFNATRYLCSPTVREKIKKSGGTLVIRPDSGPPVEILEEIFNILEEELGDAVTLNNKGYKVLPNELRVIQGDGINLKMVDNILHKLVYEMNWSATNITFGSGGGLLQQFNRDTQKFAYKFCAAFVDGKWVDVRKDPITDSGKKSKEGKLDIISDGTSYKTIKLDPEFDKHDKSIMNIVFDCGDITHHTTLNECRDRIKVK